MTALTGTRWLVLLALRRDRVLLPVWLVAIAALTAAVINSMASLYASPAEREAAATVNAASAAARIFDGPASGTTLGAMAMVEAYQILAILVALMSGQAVIRHTRQDEETGRAELLGAAVIGRHTRLTAALLVAAGANIVLAATIALVLAAHDLGIAGSLAGGAAVGAVGVVFAAVAAVCAQVSESQRGANLLTAAALGAAFLLRALGDAFGRVAPSQVEAISAWPSWLSPLGWGQQVRPFHQDNWAVFGLFAGLSAVLVAVAFTLTNHRDLGAGIVATRLGRPTAPAGLRNPMGMAWRLQRGTLLAWAIGLAILGGAFGAVGDSVDDFVGASEQLEEMIMSQAGAGGLVDLYFTFAMGFLGVAAAGYTVQAVLRMRGEEAAGRLEPVLATAVSRVGWVASHVTIATAGTLAVLGATGLSGAAAYWLIAGDLGTGLGMLGAALAQVPAALALGGFVVATFALLPRWTPALGWAALAASLVMGQLGQLLELPQSLLNLSPFTHVPPVPAEAFNAAPAAVLLAVAALLAVTGAVAFRRRDLAITA